MLAASDVLDVDRDDTTTEHDAQVNKRKLAFRSAFLFLHWTWVLTCVSTIRQADTNLPADASAGSYDHCYLVCHRCWLSPYDTCNESAASH